MTHSTDNRAPVQVGVVLARSLQPSWIRALVDSLRQSDAASLAWVCVMDPPQDPIERKRGLALRRFQKWDDERHAKPNDAFAVAALDESVLTAPAASGEVDVVLAFVEAECPKQFLALAKLGCWSVTIGHGESAMDRSAGVREVLERTPVTRVALWSQRRDGSTELLRQSFVSTHIESPYVSRLVCCQRASSLILRQLNHMDEAEAGTETRDSCLGKHGAVSASSVARHFGVIASRRLRYRRYKDQWMLAYKFEPEPTDRDENLDGLRPLIPPSDLFWADPFPVEHEGRYYVFFEEATYQPRRGHISVSELKPNGTFAEPRVVLKQDYHMSYPYVFRYGDSFYMVPETYAGGSVDLYECTGFPYEWRFHSSLMPDTRAVDSTIFEHDGRWWLFAAMGSEEAAFNEELCVFYAETPFGPWEPHGMNPVISDARIARPAGRPFVSGNKLMRPVQDCSCGIYGRALRIRQIVTLTRDVYEERDCYGFEPDWYPGLTATHTLNRAGNLLVVDGRRSVRR